MFLRRGGHIFTVTLSLQIYDGTQILSAATCGQLFVQTLDAVAYNDARLTHKMTSIFQ